MKNEFKKAKFYDHEIVDENGSTVGSIRVKPSGILWAPKGSHGVDLPVFADWFEKFGKKQKK